MYVLLFGLHYNKHELGMFLIMVGLFFLEFEVMPFKYLFKAAF